MALFKNKQIQQTQCLYLHIYLAATGSATRVWSRRTSQTAASTAAAGTLSQKTPATCCVFNLLTP